MTSQVGSGVFTEELSFIHNQGLRELVKSVLDKAPKYFYEVPASSTGKYHPQYALGKGGLVRHTKAAVKIAMALFDNPLLGSYTLDEKDIIIGALILHDCCKHGFNGSRYSVFDHPLLVENLINMDEVETSLQSLVTTMINCIRSHMGPWVRDRSGRVILPVPETDVEIAVHMADYLASRKFIEITF